MVIVLLRAAHPEIPRHVSSIALFFLPLNRFLVGHGKELAAVLLYAPAHLQFPEVYVGVLVLDVLGVEGIEYTHTGRVDDYSLIVAAFFADWHTPVLFGLGHHPTAHGGEGDDDGDVFLVHIILTLMGYKA